MPQCNTIRSFKILLIVKLVVESHVDAFTIRRVVESTFQPDLIVPEANFNQKEESFKVIDISNVNKENNVTSPESKNTEKIVANIEEERNKVTEKVKTTNNITDIPVTKATEKILNVKTNNITVTTLSSTPTLHDASSSSMEAEVETERDERKSLTVTENKTAATEGTTNINSTLKNNVISTISSTIVSNEPPNSSEPSVTVTGIVDNGTKSSENYIQMNKTTNYASNTISNEENNTQKYETITILVDNDSYSTETIVTETMTTTEPDITSKEVDDYTHQESSTASSLKSVLDNVVHKALELNTEQETTTEQNSAGKENTQFIKDYSTESLIPYWKKYTEIDRKRFNSTEQAANSTNNSETLVHAESGQTSPTVFPRQENTFSISKIASSDKLTHELLKSTSELPPEMPASPGTDPNSTLSPVDTTQAYITETSSILPRLDVVSSLRAGYLDYSSRFTEEPQIEFEKQHSTTITEASILNLNEEMSTKVGFTEFLSKEPSLAAVTTPESAAPLWEIGSSISNQETTSESVNQMNKTQGATELESQSQLTEDAINEELMKEKILTDNVEYSKRYRNERFQVKALNNNETFSTETPQINQPEDTSIDDKLSVKPISFEKKNISTIYTVNSNYKPLKKIDVLPPKSFLRNPDDNSWRNESLSTLGIVFKAKNSSKAFTQVLKNKTEMQLNSFSETKSAEQSPELRTRLEKIAEQRKSKKKKTDYLGNTYYTDYEENTSSERTTTYKTNVFDDIMSRFTELTTTGPENFITEPLEINKINLREFHPVDTFKTRTKQHKIMEQYDSEEDEVDYAHDIDLKKFKTKNNYVTPKASSKTTTQPTVELQTTVSHFSPERKPTVQYFPPRERSKVIVNEYDDSFRSKLNEYTFNKPQTHDIPPITAPPTYVPWNRTPQYISKSIWQNKADVDKNRYVTHPTTNFDQNSYLEKVRTDGYHRPSYLIKHLKDFINDVTKDDDIYVTEVPYVGVTAANEGRKSVKAKPPPEYYDYEAQFRKDVLDRFVENFNQHSERFKVNFPILYNTSVVHSKLPDQRTDAIALSNAFMKRLYESKYTKQDDFAAKRFDPNCDKTIELSPSYELHYYVPEEEEKQIQDTRPTNAQSFSNVPPLVGLNHRFSI